MNQLTINLSPVLANEVYGHTVETGLYDTRGGNDVGLSAADISLYEKIEKNSSSLTIETLGEAASLYNALYNLLDYFDDWIYSEGPKWRFVKKAALARMEILRGYGVTTDSHGWAIQK